jgi:hypothetical protein
MKFTFIMKLHVVLISELLVFGFRIFIFPMSVFNLFKSIPVQAYYRPTEFRRLRLPHFYTVDL